MACLLPRRHNTAPGGPNGNGSESTLYHQTATNTLSNMVTDLSLFGIGFPGGGTAMATNTTGLLNNNLAIAPGVGGATGTAPADYGTIFTSPQDIVVPPIDVSGLSIPGLTTLNLGTLKGINLNVALRNVVLDLHSGSLPLSGGGSYPAQFDSTQVSVTLSGMSDMSLTATLKQDNLTNWVTTGAALLCVATGTRRARHRDHDDRQHFQSDVPGGHWLQHPLAGYGLPEHKRQPGHVGARRRESASDAAGEV